MVKKPYDRAKAARPKRAPEITDFVSHEPALLNRNPLSAALCRTYRMRERTKLNSANRSLIATAWYTSMEIAPARRPLKSRNTGWARATARLLLRLGFTPNVISVASALFAAEAGMAFYLAGRATSWQRMVWLILAVAGIQLRLLCNLLDGMIAIEGGQKTKSGEVFNDLPDRLSDALILVPVGYSLSAFPYGAALGWCAALLAVGTAYVRMLGGASGLEQSFIGPMAKQQRMAVLTAAGSLSIFESRLVRPGTVLWVALIIINAGCLITIFRRTRRIVRELEAR